ncbi:MAG: hypothetical protein WBA43_08350 [Elainellaceae cyanobacterium]
MDLHFSLPRMGSTSKLGQPGGSDRLGKMRSTCHQTEAIGAMMSSDDNMVEQSFRKPA